jgi:hypothetical protein
MAPLLPPRRKQALRDFAVQILNTTLAVLIALSFDGLVEWYRIRRLVATAQAHMDSEIAENRKDVAAARGWSAKGLKGAGRCLGEIGRQMAARESKQPPPPFDCGALLPQTVLSTTSRSTAEATGALGHMPYTEVKRYAAAYEYQQTISHTFERLGDHYAEVKKLFKVDVRQLGLDELKVLRTDFLTYATLLDTLHGQTATMLKFYDAVLGRR